MANIPATIDEYLATVNDEKRAALEKLRQTIKAVAPDAVECISYRLPEERLNDEDRVMAPGKPVHAVVVVLTRERFLEGKQAV